MTLAELEGVRFEPIGHLYFAGTRKLAGVSEVLGAAGYTSDGRHFTEAHRERGTLVHEATQLVDNYQSTWEQVSRLGDAVGGYAESYAKFLVDHRVRWRLREAIVADLPLGVAGRLDALGDIDDLQDALVDFKSGADDACYGPQTAAYERMAPKANVSAFMQRKRFVLLLQADGRRAVLVPKPDRGDYQAFLSAAYTFRWRQMHGRLA